MPFYALSKKGAALDTWGNVIHVHAKTTSDAIAHILADCCINSSGTHILIQEMEVVDLTVQSEPSLPFVPPPGPHVVKPTAASTQGEAAMSEAQNDDISHAEVMALTGLKSQQVSDYKYRGVFTKGVTPRTTSRASVLAWMADGAKPRSNANAERAAKMRAAKAANRATQAPPRIVHEQVTIKTTKSVDLPKAIKEICEDLPETIRAPKATSDGMIREEVLADNLGIAVEIVQGVKRRGNVAGGYGWVELGPWMAHYKEEL